ncbi:MAG TPA: DUF1080 domain-containing protein [Bryobacteraceae bacterium]|jgi:hypothetical protein|nr:DUF1080 domain-containing protein [Bryobacteraceae bacterium]
MCRLLIIFLAALMPLGAAERGWTSLFNGKDLSGWQVNEEPETWHVEDGAIVAHGKRSHCFYMGDFHGHSFRNFELKVDVKAAHNSNGGVYVLTQFQPKGFPGKGFEVQVNNTYNTDPRKTGSLYEVQDVHEQLVPDDTWFTEHIVVKGDTITVRVNGKQVVNWTQPANWGGTSDFSGRRIEAGTIALQRHDPNSVVYYKNIRIKLLK